MNFNSETGKSILIEILKAMNSPENAKNIAEAKGQCGKEMIKMLQFVFPIVLEIQTEVLRNYGFQGREGMIQFSQVIREFEKVDPEIARLKQQIRTIYLPPIMNNSTNDILI